MRRWHTRRCMAGGAAAVLMGSLIGCAAEPRAKPAEGPGRPVAPSAPTPPTAPSAPVAPATPSMPTTPAAPSAPASSMREVFPHVRVDVTARVVEVDGAVAVDCHDAQTPRVYLELVACTPDSREHESLVVTSARPAHIHAALLMIGLEPGAPGAVRWDGARHVPVAPTGPGLAVRLRTRDAGGATSEVEPQAWIVDAESGRTFPGELGAADLRGWVFAGSRTLDRQGPDGVRRRMYDADAAGTVIGLATFGSETISWRAVFSPDEAVTPAAWIADARRVPTRGTPVTIVLSPEAAR